MGGINNYKVYAHVVKKEISGYDYDKYYIGISNRNNLNDRWGTKGQGYKTQPFYRAIQKYGWENIEHRILFTDLNVETARDIERSLVSILDCIIGHKGYNSTSGGDGVKDCSKIKYNNVYCIELNRAFKSISIASQITGDLELKIRSNCDTSNRKNYKPRKEPMKYSYCYTSEIYDNFYIDGNKTRMNSKVKPIVRLSDGKIYGNRKIIKDLLGINLNRKTILTFEKYLKMKHKNDFYKIDRFMYLEDYLKFFDYTN